MGFTKKLSNAQLCRYFSKQSMGARNRVGIGLSYRPARLHRLAELIPWNRFFGFLKVFKFGLCIHVYTVQCVRGVGYGVLGLRQINTSRKAPLQVNFFRRQHFALSSTESYLSTLCGFMVVYMTESHYSLGMVTRTWSTLYSQWQFLIYTILHCAYSGNVWSSPMNSA